MWWNWLGTCFKRITTDDYDKSRQLPRMPQNSFGGGVVGAIAGGKEAKRREWTND